MTKTLTLITQDAKKMTPPIENILSEARTLSHDDVLYLIAELKAQTISLAQMEEERLRGEINEVRTFICMVEKA